MPDVDLWILGWPVSCTKMRTSIRGLNDRNPNHTCIIGSGRCTYESAVLPYLRHFSDRWTSHICSDPRIPGENCVRYVVELESGIDREELEAKLPVEMPEKLRKTLGRFLDEPAVFLQDIVCYEDDGDSLGTQQGQVG